jgi:hypothetical protein
LTFRDWGGHEQKTHEDIDRKKQLTSRGLLFDLHFVSARR